jgi:hypothetical protein
MEIEVQRGPDDGASILGKMSIDGVFQCFTLEPSASAAFPCTPPGRYLVQLLFSPRFQEITPHIENVPGRSLIEIHPGNDPQNTEGCTLVGETESKDWLGSSRDAFQALMAKLNTAAPAQIWATYENAATAAVAS